MRESDITTRLGDNTCEEGIDNETASRQLKDPTMIIPDTTGNIHIRESSVLHQASSALGIGSLCVAAVMAGHAWSCHSNEQNLRQLPRTEITKELIDMRQKDTESFKRQAGVFLGISAVSGVLSLTTSKRRR